MKLFSDPEGRFIIVDIKTENKTLTLLNIYAPNDDNPAFFENVLTHLLSFDCEDIVFGGDFNLVIDIQKDKKGGNPVTHTKALKVVQHIIDRLDLTDIWRLLNPDTERFTWRRRNPEIHCRLDFFLTSSSLNTIVTKADISPGYKTDHSLITLHLVNNPNPRGPGFWKLNTSFLLEDDYVALIKKTIEDVAKEYENNDEVDAPLLWDTMKMRIRSTSLNYGRKRKRDMKSEEASIESVILSLQRKLEENNLLENTKTNLQKELEAKIAEREEIVKYKTRGAILRSKSRWYNEGEKNTKYFLTLEKRHFNEKTIKHLQISDDSIIYKDSDILKEAKCFYQKLYSSSFPNLEAPEDIFFPKGNALTLNVLEQEECEGLLTETECLESLKSMEPNKSPGTDGLPAEFYKRFWSDVNPYLINALNNSYEKGLLSVSQRRGLISLIPKKNKPTDQLKNWRPITLLNCDYKIATKSIASRIRKVLPKIINNDQTGFMKNRFIGENIRLIDSLINFTNKEQIPGLLLFIDFEKAFDSLEWSFIHKTLQYYNFGKSLMTWIKLFYTDISSSIQNNGWASEFFTLHRGVRQGCPLSPYLFILCAEILGNAVRTDNGVRGIKILNTECKLSQYADDTTLILDGSQSSLLRTFELLDAFAAISGLNVNYEKTEALWIGSLRDSNISFPLNKPITWAREKVFALGVWFSTGEMNFISSNIQEKIDKLKKIIGSWSARRLTLLGKITVLKSLAVSQLVYVLASLPTIHGALKEINSLLYEFLWDAKNDKIKRSEMINDYDKGGLKMIDIESFNKSLKLKWIQGYLNDDNHAKWKLFFDYYLEKFGGKLVFLSNLSTQDAASLDLTDPFLKEVLEHWTNLNYREENLDFMNSYIWQNSLIRIGNQPLFYPSWLEAGVTVVKDLVDIKQDFLSFDVFENKFQIKTNYLEYYKIRSALKQYKKSCSLETDKPHTESAVETIQSSQKVVKKLYKLLIEKKATHPSRTEEKWKREIQPFGNVTVDWKKSYQLPFLCTRDSKLRVFQFKLLHRRIATNDFLCKIGLEQTDLCSFCKETAETLMHLFWNCRHTKLFWERTFEWITQNFKDLENFKLSPSFCLGLIDNISDLLVHQIILIARSYIYTCKFKSSLPKLEMFIQLVKIAMKVEKQAALENNTVRAFEVKWSRLR